MRITTLLSLSLTLLGLVTSISTTAQDLHTVRAGVFRDVRGEDFAAIRDLGYVYSLEAGERETEVYVGQFSTQDRAAEVATALNQRGFRNARVFSLPAGAGERQTMVQFALHSATKLNNIPWGKYVELGDLYAQSVDGDLKLLTGPYTDAAAARAAQLELRRKGYEDAFVKQVSSLRLIEIDGFETGIKQAYIPIKYADPTIPADPPAATSAAVVPPAAPPAPAPTLAPADRNDSTAVGAPVEVAATPQVYATPTPPTPAPAASPKTTTPPPAPVVTSAVNVPRIDGSVKRHSVAELQKVLKQKGYYDGSLDGLYGPGTKAGYERAWASAPEVRKYRTLAEANFAPLTNQVVRWPEVDVLLAVVQDLSAGNTDIDYARDLAAQRTELFQTKQKLTTEAQQKTAGWEATIEENLQEWATEDPLHAQIFTAFRISYYQTQVRLEQHFQNAGFGAIEARDLAIAALQNLTGAQLARFI